MADAIDLVVPNIAEFNLRNPVLRLDPAVERGFAAVGAKLADQAVFWTDEPRVLVLPAGLDRLWFADVHDVLGLDQPPVVSPTERTGLLVADLLRDGAALGMLLTITAGYRTVRMRCWGVTPEIYQLAAIVRSGGPEVELDGPAEEGYWASLYLESKQSCVDLAARLPGLRVPYSITVANWAELRGAAAAELGYRGWLCVNCVYGRDGALYVTELNARRSGAMHSIALLRRWTGRTDGDTAGTYSDDSVPVRTRAGRGSRACYRDDIRPLFQRLWTDGVRALPTTVRGLDQPRPEIAVLAAADTAGAAGQVVSGIRAAAQHGP